MSAPLGPRDLLVAGQKRLEDAGIEGARRDARWLLAHAAGVEDAAGLDAVDAAAAARFWAAIDRRAAREPVSHILERRAFFGRDFKVTADVLDPRPETERIVEWVLAGPAPRRILDLGTGSGALLVSLLAACPDATGVGSDMSAAALRIAEHNAQRYGVDARASFVQANWASGIEETFDVIVCNPPYIAHGEAEALQPEVRAYEPHLALFGGADGLEAYRAIACGLARCLGAEGRAIFEFGLGQGPEVAAIFAPLGLGRFETVQDLSGRDRFLALYRGS